MKPNLIAAIVADEFFTIASPLVGHPDAVQTLVLYVMPAREFTFTI